MKRKLFILLILTILQLSCWAQESLPQQWQYYLELLAEDGNENMIDELIDLYETYHDNPANINDTIGGLIDFPFVSEWQRHCLRGYILDFGPILTLEELYLINGFDSTTIALLRPLVICSPIVSGESLSIKQLLTQGRSNLVLGASGTIEQAKGYTDNTYEGDNLRLMWRYYYKYKDRVQLQLSGDKDPGEAFFSGSQHKGFDFYGFSLMINDLGKYREGRHKPYIKRALVGQYHVQIGQGLTMWSGFGSHYPMGASLFKTGQGIRPSGSFSEYGFLQGVASNIAITPNWEIVLFYSNNLRDATLPRKATSDTTIDWVQSLYNSGYHRTQTEINKKNQIREQIIGSYLQFKKHCFKVGLSSMATWYDKEIIPAKYVYNDHYFHGNRNFNSGLDFAYRKGRILAFGEGSICVNNATDQDKLNISPALIMGAEWTISSLHLISTQLHYYSPTFHNFHANALGESSSPQNDLGGSLLYAGRLPWNITLNSAVTISHFPHMKYGVYAPSNALEYRLLIEKPIHKLKGLNIQLRYRYKAKEQNTTPSTIVNGQYQLEETYRHQIQCNLEYCKGAWKLTSRIAYAHYHGQISPQSGGFLLFQDIQYLPKLLPLSLGARIAWFDIDDYDARLYTIESDFAYQYNSSVFLNEGYRGYLIAKYDISKNWNIGFKYSITTYTNQETYGSGDELINTNHRQQWRIQIRLKW
ncbi:MAG: hypothetical protein KBT28_01400 [Bacteroidales bacterium]|nr:hypothetical protein [Candidatus Colimorpha merdihippi]